MNLGDYLIDLKGKDWDALLRPWAFPDPFSIWMVNRFGDLIVTYDDGSVHWFDVNRGRFERLADNMTAFEARFETEAGYWLLPDLVDKCVEAGVLLKPHQCYFFKTPTILGGKFDVANIAPVSLTEQYAFLADLHEQIKDIPDGAQVRLVVGQESSA